MTYRSPSVPDRIPDPVGTPDPDRTPDPVGTSGSVHAANRNRTVENHCTSRTLRRKALPVLGAAVLAGVLFSGCADPAPGQQAADTQTHATSTSGPAVGSSTESSPESASPLAVHQPWVKAAESRMTGAFGILANNGTEDIRVVAATSPAAASVELHETVAGPDGTFTMAETTDGFVIAAGSEFALEPGANHLMLMGLKEPLLAGDEVAITLELADGSTMDFTAVVKDFSGANESYHGS